MKSAWLRASALLLIVFGAGGALGYGFGVRRGSGAAAPASPMDPATVVRTLKIQLGLSAAQADSVQRILARRQAVIDSAWVMLRPGVRAAMDTAEMEIVAVLRPDQQARFLELMRVSHPSMGDSGR